MKSNYFYKVLCYAYYNYQIVTYLFPIVLLPSSPTTVYLSSLNYPLSLFPNEKADINHEREPVQGFEDIEKINYHLMHSYVI